MATYPQVNGNRYDFSSVEFNLRGRTYVGIKEIQYSDELEPGDVRGTLPQRVGRTRGEYKTEGSCTMYRQEFDELVADLGDGFGEVPFDAVVTYANDGQPTITDKLVGCRIKKAENSHSQGTDPLEVKLDLDFMYLLRNGKALVKGLRR